MVLAGEEERGVVRVLEMVRPRVVCLCVQVQGWKLGSRRVSATKGVGFFCDCVLLFDAGVFCV